jgi:hypothetical protein
MTDRENSPAFQMLPRSARRVFGAIERAIGNGSSASVSYEGFRLDHHIGRQNISSSLKLLHGLGLIEIEPGPRLVNVFRFSNRWRTVDEVEAVRLAALARELRAHRKFERRREPKPGKKLSSQKTVSAPPPKPMTVERPRTMQRRVPSLPTMPWQDDGVETFAAPSDPVLSKVQSVDQRMRLGRRCRLSPTAHVPSHRSGAAMCQERKLRPQPARN